MKKDKEKIFEYLGPTFDEGLTTWIDDDKNSHDGLMLVGPHFFSKYSIDHPALMLVDKNGKTQHQWQLEADYQDVFKLDHFKLYNNGDVIVSMAQADDNVYKEDKSRLIKMDKDSNIIWQKTGNFYDWFDEYNDNIYALTFSKKKILDSFSNLDFSLEKNTDYIENNIAILSSKTGKLSKTISISKAFVNSKFKDYLNLSIVLGHKLEGDIYDIFHTNSIQYLNKKLAKNLPFAQPGDLLLSFRQLDMIAILRPSEENIVWVARGPWKTPHNVQLTDNGKILIFDNEGGAIVKDGIKEEFEIQSRPRILEYNPIAHKTKTIYQDSKKRSLAGSWYGGFQKLDNGHFIVFSSQNSRIIEIDENDNVLWELRGINDRDKNEVHNLAKVPQMHYFKRSDLNFI